MDLSVGLQRSLHMGSKHIEIMVAKGQGPGTHNSVCCEQMFVCIRWPTKSSCRGVGGNLQIVRHVMEDVREEFRLALRENN